MRYQVSTQAPADIQADCIVVTLEPTGKLSDAAQQLDQTLNGFLQARIDSGDISGKQAETLLLPGVQGLSNKLQSQRVLLVGSGKSEEKPAPGAGNLVKVLDAIAKGANSIGGDIAVDLSALSDAQHSQAWLAEQLAIAFARSQYRFSGLKQDNDSKQATGLIVISPAEQQADIEAALARGQAIGQGVNYARDLGNLAGNVCTPSYLANEAEKLASGHERISATIIDEQQMAEMGAGAFVSVAKGSSEPGKLIILEYKGGKADDAPHMILGKGITFDTGGISLKPGAKMDEMKYDMCGAASVLGTMAALAELKPAINILAMITSAENMPAGDASKPGDVVTSLSGQTIEILNTDAEGRLVLCDALTYGIDNYKPASIVDIATLTGACMAALGGVNSGLFTQDEGLASELQSAATVAHDKVWRLPLEDDYQELLDTNFADMANIGGPLAGATTAACFLARFTEGTPWAHLDIAGTAWGGAGKTKGASGRPVGLLVNYLLAK